MVCFDCVGVGEIEKCYVVGWNFCLFVINCKVEIVFFVELYDEMVDMG